MEAVDWVAHHFGVTHFNAAMMVVLAYLLYRWFKSLIASIERQGTALGEMATDLKLSRQWQEFHESEDNRRFAEMGRRVGDRREDV